jgi:hypothetical protein
MEQPQQNQPQQQEQPQEQQQQPQYEPISKYINLETAKSLQQMGYSKNVSEKACLFTQSNIDNALDWIMEHMNDPDFEEEAKISKPESSSETTTSTLSPEEAKAKAKEYQEKIRKHHLQKEKELQEEQERLRVRSVKEMAMAKKIAEEQEMKRYVERQKKAKAEAEYEKKKMLEQLARDKEERFGKKFDAHSGGAVQTKTYTKEENAMNYLNKIKLLYRFTEPQKVKVCFNTLKVILNNIKTNPNEEKFRKVKITNPNVQERIGSIKEAIEFLKEISFVNEGEFLVCKAVDITLFDKLVSFLNDEANKIF